MTFELRGLPVFYEDFDPARPTQFDFELDEMATNYARAKKVIKGFCNISAAATKFVIASDNLREDIVAQVSHSINRHRQVVCALSLALFNSPHASLFDIAAHINEKQLKVYTAEAHSPLFHFLREQLAPELFVYSEYFDSEYQSGVMVNGIQHEDLQRTSFADEAFDIVLTFEVFEHIPDALIAEQEVVRILKPDGVYCFTAPFLPDSPHDLVLADVAADGTIRYFAEPQYHGDPIRPEQGILVYRIFSFNDLKRRFEALGCRFNAYRFWSKTLGILGDDAWVMMARKTDEAAFAPELSSFSSKPPRDMQVELAQTRAQLATAHAQLAKKSEVLDWIQTSRSWRLATSLRHLRQITYRGQQLQRRLRRFIHLPESTIFQGALEAPAGTDHAVRELYVEGWVFSTAAPVIRVEAFLGEYYLGTVNYGLERLDIAAKYPTEEAKYCGYAERFSLNEPITGTKQLTVRVFDAQQHRHLFTRMVKIER